MRLQQDRPIFENEESDLGAARRALGKGHFHVGLKWLKWLVKYISAVNKYN